MKRYSHDELHRAIAGSEELSERSEKIHALPQTDSIEKFGERKREIIKIYAKAVGCKKTAGAMELADEIMAYVRQYAATLEEWRRTVSSGPEHGQAIRNMAQNFLKKGRCCSPGGNDYVCFCDEH